MAGRVGGIATGYLAGLLVAAVIGGIVGGWISFIGSIPNMAAMLSVLIAMGFALIVAVTFIIGVVQLPFGRTRSGVQTIGFAIALAGGAFIGGFIGPDWRNPTEMPALVEVTVDAPVSQTFSGSGTCRTVANGDVITDVESGPIIEVGADRMILSIRLPGAGSLGSVNVYGYLTEGRLADYRTPFNAGVEFETDDLRKAGSGMFGQAEASETGERIGGANGPDSLSGSFSWTCLPDQGR